MDDQIDAVLDEAERDHEMAMGSFRKAMIAFFNDHLSKAINDEEAE